VWKANLKFQFINIKFSMVTTWNDIQFNHQLTSIDINGSLPVF
jgi:hypothetical protein